MRLEAEGALVKLGDPAVEALAAAPPDEYEHVAFALGRLGERRAVEPLVEALRDPTRAWHAADLLGELGDRRAVEPLIDALGSEDWNARAYVAAALGKLADPRAVDPLVAACNDEHESVRGSAREALVKIGAPEAAEAASRDELKPAAKRLEALLTSGPVDWFKVEDDAKTLASLILPERRNELLADLEDTFVSSGWLAARTLASEALAELGEPEGAARVDPRRRAVELIALSDLSAEAAAETLAELYDATVLHDLYYGEDRPRNHVVRALGEKLNELGGFALMLEAHERFSGLRPPTKSPSPGAMLEQAWHGIGEWMA